MPSDEVNGAARKTDPLEALPAPVFLNILEQLPSVGLAKVERVSKSWRSCIREHERSLWRTQLLKLNLPEEDVTGLLSQEAAHDRHDPTSAEISPPPVDWRAECRRQVLLERNWQKGRCRNKWIKTSGGRVWRFKIDQDEGTMLCTTESGELEVLDMPTSTPLFAMRIGSPHAHLEFERGFAVFDEFDETSGKMVLRVFQTPTCRAHSWPGLHPFLPMPDGPRVQASRPEWAPQDPRGQLTHFRVIEMPRGCRAYRLHVDKAGTPHERTVLLATASYGLHLWDIVNPAWQQIIRCDASDLGYLELDDDYIFAATKLKTLIFSRASKTQLSAFPPKLKVSDPWPGTPKQYDCQGFELFSFEHGRPVMPPGAGSGYASIFHEALGLGTPIVPPSDLDKVQVLTLKKAVVLGVLEDHVAHFDWYQPFDELRLAEALPSDNGQLVSAVHYTDKHLVSAHEAGYIFVLRDYAATLAIPDKIEREKLMAENTTLISLHERITGLAIYGDYIAVTGNSLYWFRSSDIPATWQPDEQGNPPADVRWEFPIFRAQSLPIELTYIHPPSCLQIDRKGIYLAHETRDYPNMLEDMLMEEPRAERWHREPQPPPRLARPEGGAVRCWDFSPA